MATIKAYTDLEQSKKLAKILPLESADMEYLAIKENGALTGDVPFVKDDSEVEDSAYSHIFDKIPCWSLAALLYLIRKFVGCTIHGEHEVYISCELGDKPYHIETKLYDNEVDACIEMIEKLHKFNLL